MNSRIHIAMCFHLNAALGSGTCNDVTVELIKERIRDRTTFDYLRLKVGEVFALDYVPEDQQGVINDEWFDFATRFDDLAVFGVQRNGICLLMAYLLEGIRRRTRATLP